MKSLQRTTQKLLMLLFTITFLAACNDDDKMTDPVVMPTGTTMTYDLSSVSNPDILGTAKFIENDDASVTIELSLQNTSPGMSPAHIHFNTAAEGGDIALTLGTVDGSTGKSTITTKTLDDGTPISYEDLINYDGYINVHASASDLGTLIAQGDIGQNQLTATSKTYNLGSVSDPGISGTATFTKRVNGEALAVIQLSGTAAGVMSPGHIHANTAAEGGGIITTFTPVNGDNGTSKTNIATKDDGTAFLYDDIMAFDGYINIHKSADDLATLIAQADIGQNELTATSKVYPLASVSDMGISGTATFTKRVNGEALAVIQLSGTTPGVMSPGHIHANTAAEGGAIVTTFTPVNGDNGMSKTNIATKDDGTPFLYDDVLAFDGYINIHKSADDLATLIGQGDIGQNELTATSKVYTLNSKSDPAISGTATFTKRVNGEALAVVKLMNTPAGVMHPGHIHVNTAAEGGGIAYTFKSVNGTTGISKSNVAMLDDGTPFGYDDVLGFDGYINFHYSAADLATLVAQGDIGQNELTGNAKTYPLGVKDVIGVSGTAKFEERVNGSTLVTLSLLGTVVGGVHPAHIHNNTAAMSGPIAVTLKSVVGATGKSLTQVSALDSGTPVTYSDLIAYNGYINVHASVTNLASLLAQGNIGVNAN